MQFSAPLTKHVIMSDTQKRQKSKEEEKEADEEEEWEISGNNNNNYDNNIGKYKRDWQQH